MSIVRHQPLLGQIFARLSFHIRKLLYVTSLVATPLLVLKNKLIENLTLPTCWEKNDSFRYIDIIDDKLGLLYSGPGNESDAAASRANNPIPSDIGIYYYEIEIIDEGEKKNIGIGFSEPNASLNRLPGWDWNSYGYHGDDGNRFWCGRGIRYGPLFSKGDVVGCGINYLNQSAFYTINGIHLGTAFMSLKGEYYPMVGMRSIDERILVNFGSKPFLFDINNYSKAIFSEYLKRWEERKKEPDDDGVNVNIINNILPDVPILDDDFYDEVDLASLFFP
ncbi:10098_t:CDS:2 [Funneliformis geosporum]|nr:10098_t:CDS:2 [Funneliformis geosporum]